MKISFGVEVLLERLRNEGAFIVDAKGGLLVDGVKIEGGELEEVLTKIAGAIETVALDKIRNVQQEFLVARKDQIFPEPEEESVFRVVRDLVRQRSVASSRKESPFS